MKLYYVVLSCFATVAIARTEMSNSPCCADVLQIPPSALLRQPVAAQMSGEFVRVIPSRSQKTPDSIEQTKPKETQEGQISPQMQFAFKALDSQIVSTILTIIATFFGFLGSQYLERRKRTAEDNRRYRTLLVSTKDEIEFYMGTLKVLSAQLEQILANLKANQSGVVLLPSYSIYPSFLEGCKNQMNSFMRDSELTKTVGRCHFELCHVLERLTKLKHPSTTPYTTNDVIVLEQNIKGFAKLVEATVSLFEKTVKAIDKRIKQGESQHKL